ncbi:hypothetical protein JI58_02665 [Marinosulfonomonas sp. PRT-SC04]|nr:hypothetical protein JI58_02665 [Marinosulfonomonas sp. PRT-SC04]
MINTGWMLLLIVASGLIYIRIAPHNIVAVHVVPDSGSVLDQPMVKPGSALFSKRFQAPSAAILDRLNEVALASKRTRILAGSVEEGMITYVTRSLVFGFPDYTTVHVVANDQGSRVTIYGRLRFGESDFGVNRTRISAWLKALQPID